MKMQKQFSKSPEIRFKKYTNRWEIRKLGEISNKVTEKNKDNIYTETLTNSAEHGIINQRDYFDKDISNKKNLNNYYVVRSDDFVYNPRISSFAPVGPIKRNKLGRTGVMSPLYYVFRTHDVNVSFLETYFGTTSWHRFMKMNGDSGARSDRFAIKDAVFREMPIPIPSSEEQADIGNFYRQLDEIITLQQQKLDLLQNNKKSLLQKLFPKKGEKVPEIRFSGFTADWEQCKLGEIGSTFNGLSGKTKLDFGHGEASYVTYLNVLNNAIADLSGIEKTPIDRKQNEVQFGDVFFTTSSETPEEVGMSSVWLGNQANVYLNSFCFGFRPSVHVDSYYLASMLRSTKIRVDFTLLAQGISRYNISKVKAMDIMVPLPKVEEQTAIGDFFKHLDSLITLHQRKLDSFKKIKKTMLQKMFI